MSVVMAQSGGVQRALEQLSASQLSTNSFVAITGLALDMGAWRSLSVTAKTVTNNTDIGVYGANSADYSDEVLLDTMQPTTSAPDSFADSYAPYRFYRCKIKATSGGSQGTATVTMIAK